MKMMNLQYFCIFMYIWWLLKCLEMFFYGKLAKPSRHARTFQLVSQQSLASINNKNPKILTKRPPVATSLLRHPAPSLGHWYTGYTFGSLIQARAISIPSWGSVTRWLQAIYRVSKGRPHLQLYRKWTYIHYLWLYSENTAKTSVLFDEN